MLLIIVFIFMLLLGSVFIYLNSKDLVDANLVDIADVLGAILTGVSSVALVISIIVIIISNMQADNVIQKNKIEYEGLCKRYEIIKSEYEDVSKSDVIGDITAWNMKVYDTKYWTENPWTNWFNPKKIADNLEYIPLDEEEDE